MTNKYLVTNTKVTVNGFVGYTVGITIFTSTTVNILVAGATEAKHFPRSAVELYVAPRKVRTLFTAEPHTDTEVLMAKLLQATSHEDVVKTALDSLDSSDHKKFTVTHSPATATSKWTLLLPQGLLANEKIPVFIAHTDLHPNLKHPTIANLEYQNNTFTSPTGLGADDRAGIFAITQLLPHIDYMPFAVLFPDEEEIGCKGTHAFTTTIHYTDLDKYTSMYISIDRRRNLDGTSSIATYGKNNDALNKQVSTLLNRNIVKGSSTDCRALSIASARKVPCFNLSCGYTNEHTKNETLYFKELEQTVDDLMTLLTDSTIVNKEYKVDYIAPATYNFNNAYELEDSISVGNQWFEKPDIEELLALYTYYTGSKYSVNKNAFNEIVPTLSKGTIVRLNPTLLKGQNIGGQPLTKEMFITLGNDLWEVVSISNTLQLTLNAVEGRLSCSRVPQAWLEEVLEDEAKFTK